MTERADGGTHQGVDKTSRHSDWIAGAIHDLKSPMSVVKLRLQMMRKAPDHALEYIDAVEYQMARLEALVDDISLLSRLERGTLTTELILVDVKALVRRIYRSLEPLAHEKQLRFRLEEPVYDLPLVLADENQLERVVVNLATNAIRYTPPKGVIMLATGCDQGHVMIGVDDNGLGIDAADLPHIFDRFYRGRNNAGMNGSANANGNGHAHTPAAHYVGSGLGLAIAREIIEEHGGTIEVFSQKGQGSSFTVSLPIREASA